VRGRAFGVACRNNEIGGVAPQQVQHRAEQPFVVLQVAVHDGGEIGLAREHALQACPGQAAPAQAANAAHTTVGRANLFD
jgi:hypothetical protein